MEVSVTSRIIELKKIIAAQEKYNKFFSGALAHSRNLEDALKFQQSPIIKAITKLEENVMGPSGIPEIKNKRSDQLEKVPIIKAEEPIIKAEEPIIKAEEPIIKDQNIKNEIDEKYIPFIPDIDLKNIGDILTENIKPKFNIRNNFLYITIGKSEIFLSAQGEQRYFLIGDPNEPQEKIPYSDSVMNLICGRGSHDENAIDIYLNKLKIVFPKKNKYYISLTKKTKKGKGLTGPIDLFEKLTLLISAVKAGHDNLEEEIKKICKKLLLFNLISEEVYEKYKSKYFTD